MPQALEKCVADVQAGWKKDPKSRPAPRDPKQTAESQAYAICTASLKKKGVMSDADYAKALIEAGDGDLAGRIALLKDTGHDEARAASIALADRAAGRPKTAGMNPALVGVALTIRPFVKRQARASIVTGSDGGETMRLPTFRKSAWRHPLYGTLIFDDDFFSALSKNFDENAVGQDIPVKRGHEPREQDALGWLSEVKKEGEDLILYAPPTGDIGPDLIKTKKMPYVSAEFVLDHTDRELKVLSFSDMDEISLDDASDDGVYQFSDQELEFIEKYGQPCAGCPGEETMSDTDTKVVQFSDAEWKTINEKLEAVKGLEAQLSAIKAADAEKSQRIAELEQVNEAALIKAIVDRAKGYTDADKRKHSAVFLNALEAGLTFADISHKDQVVVHLADGDITPETVRDYYRGILRYLAENMPGVVPTASDTEGSEHNELSDGDNDPDKGKDLWEGLYPKGGDK